MEPVIAHVSTAIVPGGNRCRRDAAVAGAVLGLLFASATIASAAPPGATGDPIDLFAQMAPVFKHPRCINCHGAVNPFTGSTHGGGVIEAGFDYTSEDMGMRNAECLTCHDAGVSVHEEAGPPVRRVETGDWRLAPRRFSFVGKDTKQLCQMQADAVKARGAGPYLDHLADDDLIGMAFKGDRGGATDPSDPPGMTRTAFVAAGKQWVNDGGAMCGRWKGEIRQEETFGSDYGYPSPSGAAVTIHETATRVLTMKVENGVITPHVEASGHLTMQQVLRQDGCTTTITTGYDWRGWDTAHGDPAPDEGGDALAPLGDQAGVVRVKVALDGTYRIYFAGPVEKTSKSESTHVSGDCPVPPLNFPPDPPIESEWPHWSFTIEAKLANPSDRRRLSGAITKTVMADGKDGANRQSWLSESPAGTSRSDSGAPLPITVKTTWDLQVVE